MAGVTTAGYAADFADTLAALDVLIAGGSQERVVDTVERVTSRAPRSLREVATAALASR